MLYISKIKKIHKLGASWEEYFENPTQDYFNIEKDELNLIYGDKVGSFIRHVPDHYGPQGSFGYALIRGLNCQARCTYCYLQTYFKSPDMVRFSNTKNYIEFLRNFIEKFKKNYGDDKTLIFYDGDFQDSFGYVGIKENIQQINELTSLFGEYKNVYLEIRTKCLINNYELKITNYEGRNFNFKLYDELNISSCLIMAITFSPQENIEKYEPGTADLETRLAFGKYIVERGGKIGPRIDPIIIDEDSVEVSIEKYMKIVGKIKENIEEKDIYNWSIGVLRIKDTLYKKLKKNESDLIKNLVLENGFWKYDIITREKIYTQIETSINSENFFVCMDYI